MSAELPPTSPVEDLPPSALDADICPYCGTPRGGDVDPAQPCHTCRMRDDEHTRQSVAHRIGPWYVLQPKNPSAPGMRWDVLLGFVRKGRVTVRSIVRGPTTHQLWKPAARVRGLSREFGFCWQCGHGISADAGDCESCGAMQHPPADPNVLLDEEALVAGRPAVMLQTIASPPSGLLAAGPHAAATPPPPLRPPTPSGGMTPEEPPPAPPLPRSPIFREIAVPPMPAASELPRPRPFAPDSLPGLDRDGPPRPAPRPQPVALPDAGSLPPSPAAVSVVLPAVDQPGGATDVAVSYGGGSASLASPTITSIQPPASPFIPPPPVEGPLSALAAKLAAMDAGGRQRVSLKPAVVPPAPAAPLVASDGPPPTFHTDFGRTRAGDAALSPPQAKPPVDPPHPDEPASEGDRPSPVSPRATISPRDLAAAFNLGYALDTQPPAESPRVEEPPVSWVLPATLLLVLTIGCAITCVGVLRPDLRRLFNHWLSAKWAAVQTVLDGAPTNSTPPPAKLPAPTQTPMPMMIPAAPPAGFPLHDDSLPSTLPANDDHAGGVG